MSRIILEVVERKAIKLIKETGTILQIDLAKKLDIDPRSCSKIVRTLERRGLIKRKAIMYKGRRTYMLTPTKRLLEEFSIDPLIMDLPCLFCPYMEECYEGIRISPEKCKTIEKWLLEKCEKKKQLEKYDR